MVHRRSRSASRCKPGTTAAVLWLKPGVALKDGGEGDQSFGQGYWSCTCAEEEVGLRLEYVSIAVHGLDSWSGRREGRNVGKGVGEGGLRVDP